MIKFNRYRRKPPKVDASIFDSALSHTRRSDASEKREENSVSTFGHFRLLTSFESSPVSVMDIFMRKNRKFVNIMFYFKCSSVLILNPEIIIGVAYLVFQNSKILQKNQHPTVVLSYAKN